MDVSTEKSETQFKQDDKTENLRLANLRERRALFVALKFLSLHFVFILFYLFTVNISYLFFNLVFQQMNKHMPVANKGRK